MAPIYYLKAVMTTRCLVLRTCSADYSTHPGVFSSIGTAHITGPDVGDSTHMTLQHEFVAGREAAIV